MARFLIYEDLPQAVSRELRAAGHDARGVRDIGLQGTPDPGVYAHARDNGLVLVTADLGLADPFRYPPTHGTVLVRLPARDAGHTTIVPPRPTGCREPEASAEFAPPI